MLFDKLERHSSRTALISENFEALTFIDLIKMAKQIGMKIKKRSLVFMLTENCVESVAAYLAFIRSNCVVMLIHSQITNSEFDNIYQKYIPDFLSFHVLGNMDKLNLPSYIRTFYHDLH